MISQSSVIQASEDLEMYRGVRSTKRRFTPSWSWSHAKAASRVLSAIQWADVVHYHYGGSYGIPYGIDVAWARMLKRPLLISFWGSDIRIPEIESELNPYFAKRDRSHERWSCEIDRKTSREIQLRYARRGFTCVLGSETMQPYIQADIFPTHELVRGSIDTREIEPRYPLPGRRPIVVHSPSNPEVKGTQAVQAAVDRLKRDRGIDFDFFLVKDMPRRQALDLLREADVFLDQFVLGGYGMAAIEAMAFGKAVVCYCSPTIKSLYPADLPIVVANQDDLADRLGELLTDADRLAGVGRRCRAYVEKYHDAHKNAQQLISIYRKLQTRKEKTEAGVLP